MRHLVIETKTFEYPYLFGTNGYEKLLRLDWISKQKEDRYDTVLFFSLALDLGSRLVFGLSFGASTVNPHELRHKYSEFSPIDSVDGHILLKLQERHGKGMLRSITVTYFTEHDHESLVQTFDKVGLGKITSYIHSAQILDISGALSGG